MQTNFNTLKLGKTKKLLAGGALFLIAVIGYVFLNWADGLASNEIQVTNDEEQGQTSFWGKVAQILPISNDDQDRKEYVMPSPEKNRLDILILGVRGKDDPENGGLLTDSILLFSIDKTTKKSSLVSVPRDFYVRINDELKDKINSGYERLGVNGTKKLFSKITGVYIDHAIVFDFSSFQQIVDTIGGIDVTLDKEFKESTQWGEAFILPAGVNHLDGHNALYYVRSRYSSSDFDRAARQQKVILAMKEKIVSGDLLSDPLKAFSLLNTLRSNIRTDIDILDIKTLMGLADQVKDSSGMKRYVMNSENLLYETKINGTYVLLPRGNSLADIKKFFGNLPNTVTVPTPTPAASASPSVKP